MSILPHSILHQAHNSLHEKWIVCFYGFGQNEQIYLPLLKYIPKSYSILIIHLPYQDQDPPWTKMAFIQEIQLLLNKYRIEQFIGLSYSIGSRMNLCIAECLPEKIKQLILIAPDGVKLGFWNKFATETILGSLLFSYLMNQKNLLLILIKFVYQLKLINRSLYLFASMHVRTPQSRKLVSQIWQKMRYLTPDLSIIEKNIREYKFPVAAFFGKYDTIIDYKCKLHLERKIPSSKIVLLNKGHNLLDEELFMHLATYFS